MSGREAHESLGCTALTGVVGVVVMHGLQSNIGNDHWIVMSGFDLKPAGDAQFFRIGLVRQSWCKTTRCKPLYECDGLKIVRKPTVTPIDQVRYGATAST